MHWHNYKDIGIVSAWRWMGGVSGGIREYVICHAKECTKCGKVKLDV